MASVLASADLSLGSQFFFADTILLAGVGAQHCAATLPVGETGVARARAFGAEGDRPACTSGCQLSESGNLPVREEGRGDRPGRRSRFTLARARAEPLAVEERPAASFWRKARQWLTAQ
jgi:hypothetical protein